MFLKGMDDRFLSSEDERLTRDIGYGCLRNLKKASTLPILREFLKPDLF